MYHFVPLGADVARNIGHLIRTYAERVGLQDIPPVILGGQFLWSEPWEAVIRWPQFRGDVGHSNDDSLYLEPNPDPDDVERAHPENLEGTIAHEMAHVRWDLDHGAEFWARVRALMCGAIFPRDRGWPRETDEILRRARAEVVAWQARVNEQHP